MSESWKPNASIDSLIERAKVVRSIRQFFEHKNVLEVETPILSRASGTDVQLSQWQTSNGYFMHTSPEFAMKRLLAAGSGDIFQMARVFRLDECGRRHNPEFTMLEWYRLGFDEFQLMDEVAELVRGLASQPELPVVQLSYKQAFSRFALPCPHTAAVDELRRTCNQQLNCDAADWTRDDCLDALMSMVVEPGLPPEQLTFVYDYPRQQAALARFREVDGCTVARRFELYWQGMELANGYYELSDITEQKRRFEEEAHLRAAMGVQKPVIDHNFLAALEHGLPDCAGVALGVDRLVMVLLGQADIGGVMAFTQDRS
ncbi:EF-P lysine aminoacylase EpmA [Reinekea marinisedimentorum]|uniref:EF-P lysine aminoacylase EpmA n=1 Tax=Reinekea marinisedimentorum TaxID=230495 RepID=UPI001FB23903|nr:EF-P lysine aminoacylase EpmA [Reinekea marinisedimentorum]